MTVSGRGAAARFAIGSALLVAGLITTGCSSESSQVEVGPAATSSPEPTATSTTAVADGSAVESGTADGQVPVSREQAEQAALAAVGEGRVTWSGREDDRGAAWEIEVTRPDGSEVDVLIDAAGNVVP